MQEKEKKMPSSDRFLLKTASKSIKTCIFAPRFPEARMQMVNNVIMPRGVS